MEAYFLLSGWKACADAFRADLKAAADSVVADPLSPLEAAFVGEPRAYGGRFPAWSLFRLTSRGQCPHATRFMPGEMVAQVLILAPASSPSDSDESGRGYAEEVTHEGFSAWIDRLWDLGTVTAKADIEVSSTAMGSKNEFGHAMFQNTRAGPLWAHSAEVIARL